MAADAQITANRTNAKKSTGPKSKHGKAATRWNAVHHAEWVRGVAHSLRDFHSSKIESARSRKPSGPIHFTDPLATAYIRDSQNGGTISKLAGYQLSLERSYYLALRHFERLRANSEHHSNPSPSCP